MSVIHPVLSTSGLRVALWGSFILGTMYSLPPFRMKRHPLLAAFCIVAVRGTIINAGFYSHALTAAFSAEGATAASTGVMQCLLHDYKCWSSSLFFGIFGIVIALMKDVPDAVGDRIFNIRSFTVRVGQKRVFGMMKNLLTLLFGVVGAALVQRATVASTAADSIRRAIVGVGCLVAGWSTRHEAKNVNAEDSGQVYKYYMHLWKLFYLSYLALPFAK
jgi:homogentisate phytyltransferase/homogentisate geranylgeranyltransferase